MESATGNGSTSQIINSCGEDILERFQRKLDAAKIVPTCLPSLAELSVLLAMRQVRTAEDERQIKQEVQFNNLRNWLTTLSRLESAKLDELLNLVAANEAPRFVFYIKLHYNRVRAYQLVPELAPEFLPPRTFPMHPSFPSGHSTQAHLVVNILEHVYGTARIPLHARTAAWRIARNRELAGLHYPSDSDAGFVLAAILLEEASRSQEFVKLVEALRAENGTPAAEFNSTPAPPQA